MALTTLPVDLLNFFYQGLVGNQGLSALEDLFITDDPLLIDDKIRALRQSPLCIQNTVGLDGLEVGEIAQERKIEFEEFGEGALGKGRIGADPEHLCVHLFEFGVVVPTGRKLFDSGRRKIQDIKLDDDIFLSGEAAEFQFAAPGARELEVRGLFSDLDGRRGQGACKQER